MNGSLSNRYAESEEVANDIVNKVKGCKLQLRALSTLKYARLRGEAAQVAKF